MTDPAPAEWFVVADDLTGAADVVAPLVADRAIPVLLDGAADPGGTVARCVPVRDADAATVTGAIGRAVAGCGDRRLLVKIDSAGRSPIAAISAALAGRRAVVCPALPSQGRTVEHGWVMVRGRRTVHLDGAEVVDAGDDEALARLVRRVLDDPALVPVVSSGFTRVVGGRAAPPPSSGRTRALVVVGTRHPVTVEQVAALGEAELVRCPDDDQPGDPAAVVAQAALGRLTAGHAIAVTGGDTALALLRALGADGLDVDGELEPGVPVGRVRGGRWAGTPLTLKSGGFGTRGTLVRMAGWARGTA